MLWGKVSRFRDESYNVCLIDIIARCEVIVLSISERAFGQQMPELKGALAACCLHFGRMGHQAILTALIGNVFAERMVCHGALALHGRIRFSVLLRCPFLQFGQRVIRSSSFVLRELS